MRALFRILAALAFAWFAIGGPASAAAANREIIIAKMQFGAVPTLHAGDVITWRNDDIFHHTATARDKSFDVDLPPKSERNITVKQAGKVDFYCRFHPVMTGTLDIEP
ncbi:MULTISPECIES: cupredoxin domain-containing protein [unclassified Rhizobium]|uniref:cupredoxin domain-containing protein n=1 Tax=unclassified Rhizobium TaxID=2613769 RepID=UPI000EAA35DA|nr:MULTISPECIES: cupredoxin domain-containing protein [unclassified Rhizobium]AYG69789.1 amicyanin [Rhizobium sp. CCGE531]AYG76164.1 amicyanin [Rhizobium sp. CCGE532]